MPSRRVGCPPEYSQPVLYKHFEGMELIADAVAAIADGRDAATLTKAGRLRPDHDAERLQLLGRDS